MSNTYYCHECQVRRPVLWTPFIMCARCGCNVIDQIPIVDSDSSDDLEDDFNAELDFFFHQEEQEDDDDDEETLEERCLYERLSSIYNHPIARNFNGSSSNESSSSRTFRGEEDTVSYEIQPELNVPEEIEDIEREAEVTTAANTFLFPFARFSRIFDTMYSYRSDEESEDGDENYHRRSFLDNLADILSDYAPDIEINRNTATTPTHAVDSILATLKKERLKATDLDVYEECSICQEDFGTTLEVYYLPCKHKYHGQCISRWFNINTSCPICRYPVDSVPDETQQVEESPPVSLQPEMMDQINREIDLFFASADPFDDNDDDEDVEEDEYWSHDSGLLRSDMNRHTQSRHHDSRNTSFEDIILDQFIGIYDRPSSNFPLVGLSTPATMNEIMDWAHQPSSMEEVD